MIWARINFSFILLPFFGRSFFLLSSPSTSLRLAYFSLHRSEKKLCRYVVIQLNRLWAFEGRTRRLNQLLVKDGGRRRNNKFKNVLSEWARDFAWCTQRKQQDAESTTGGGEMKFTEFPYNRANIFPTLYALHLYIDGDLSTVLHITQLQSSFGLDEKQVWPTHSPARPTKRRFVRSSSAKDRATNKKNRIDRINMEKVLKKYFPFSSTLLFFVVVCARLRPIHNIFLDKC